MCCGEPVLLKLRIRRENFCTWSGCSCSLGATSMMLKLRCSSVSCLQQIACVCTSSWKYNVSGDRFDVLHNDSWRRTKSHPQVPTCENLNLQPIVPKRETHLTHNGLVTNRLDATIQTFQRASPKTSYCTKHTSLMFEFTVGKDARGQSNSASLLVECASLASLKIALSFTLLKLLHQKR